jgi:hypothetical protein
MHHYQSSQLETDDYMLKRNIAKAFLTKDIFADILR